MGVRSAHRLFAALVAVSLLPVLLLGLVLGGALRREADRRGIAEGRSEAALVAKSAIEPTLPAEITNHELTIGTLGALAQVVRHAIDDGDVLRLRVRDLSGRVVFSDDGSGLTDDEVEDSVLDATHGQVEAEITHVNTDAGEEGPKGAKAVEVYRPLEGPAGRPIGVLEVYLPYTPIAADVNAGLTGLYVTLGIGLAVLWLMLGGISWLITRRLRRAAADNAHLASYDQLTGLPNRRIFLEEVERSARSAGPDSERVVAVIDIDNFSTINNSLGQDVGDEVLVTIAHRLREALRPGDLVARLGGDELGVLLEGLESPEDAVTEVLRLHVATSGEPVRSGEVPLTVDVSLGWTLADDGDTAPVLLRKAQFGVQAAKATHDGVVRWTSSLDITDPAQLALVSELRGALERDELVLHLQPKLNLSDHRVTGFEALVRWQHPTLGLLPPDKFLPLTERTSLIHSLTQWVVRAAIRDLQALGPVGESLGVAVNVSARDIISPGFAERVVEAVRDGGIAPYRLTIEVTETMVLADPMRASAARSRLRDAGIRTSLDDFGQGQTSLAHIAGMPLSELKIDRLFVADATENPAHAAIVRAIVDLAHDVGMVVVAEGVEDAQTLHALARFGTDVAQGWAIARPQPAAALAAWLRASTRDGVLRDDVIRGAPALADAPPVQPMV